MKEYIILEKSDIVCCKNGENFMINKHNDKNIILTMDAAYELYTDLENMISLKIASKSSNTSNIVVDIGPRRSGKTTKLINNVLDRLVNDKKSIIVCCNNETAKGIMQRIRKEINDRDLFGKFQHHREDTTFEIKNRETVYVKAMIPNCHCLIGIPDWEYMFHYDEFDQYIDKMEPYFVMPKGYYGTTPKSENMLDYKKCLDNLMKKIGR